MDEATRARRAEISRRLKAGRWLAGTVDEKGRPAPLSPEDLAEHQSLKRNGITANAIAEIERMYKDARPMELREIADALNLPHEWFVFVPSQWAGEGDPTFVAGVLAQMGRQLARLEKLVGAPPMMTDIEFSTGGADDEPTITPGRREAAGQALEAELEDAARQAREPAASTEEAAASPDRARPAQ